MGLHRHSSSKRPLSCFFFDHLFRWFCQLRLHELTFFDPIKVWKFNDSSLALQVIWVHSLKLTFFAPENRPKPKRKVIFQPSTFRGHVSFKASNYFSIWVSCNLFCCLLDYPCHEFLFSPVSSEWIFNLRNGLLQMDLFDDPHGIVSLSDMTSKKHPVAVWRSQNTGDPGKCWLSHAVRMQGPLGQQSNERVSNCMAAVWPLDGFSMTMPNDTSPQVTFITIGTPFGRFKDCNVHVWGSLFLWCLDICLKHNMLQVPVGDSSNIIWSQD